LGRLLLFGVAHCLASRVVTRISCADYEPSNLKHSTPLFAGGRGVVQGLPLAIHEVNVPRRFVVGRRALIQQEKGSGSV